MKRASIIIQQIQRIRKAFKYIDASIKVLDYAVETFANIDADKEPEQQFHEVKNVTEEVANA